MEATWPSSRRVERQRTDLRRLLRSATLRHSLVGTREAKAATAISCHALTWQDNQARDTWRLHGESTAISCRNGRCNWVVWLYLVGLRPWISPPGTLIRHDRDDLSYSTTKLSSGVRIRF